MTKKRFRKQQGKTRSEARYWVYGTHAALAAIANPERQVHRIIATKLAADKLAEEYETKQVEILPPEKFLQNLPAGAIHQGIAVQVSPLPAYELEEVLDSGQPIVLLDQVTDPHNVGAMLRSAAAFDAAALVLPEKHAPEETSILAKTACGALEIVPLIHVPNLADAIRKLKKADYWVAGLDGAADKTFAEAKLGRNTALVMGAEGAGLRRLSAELCDFLVKLPISARMESLNVSNAAAIALYELYTA